MSSVFAPGHIVQTTHSTPSVLMYMRTLWNYRDLVYCLARRDVAVRYKQTAIGALWAILQPLGLAAVFSIFLGTIAKVPTAGVAYPIFALAGMTLWLFITSGITRSSGSTLQNSDLVAKVSFPRIALPVAAILAALVDFCVSFLVLIAAILIYGTKLGPGLLYVPLVVVLATATVLGVGIWFSGLAVRYRDIQEIVPFLIQVLLFVTPVLYPLSAIPSDFQLVYALNPFVGVLEAFRWAIFPSYPSPGLILLIPISMSGILLITGLMYFKGAEQTFADDI